MKYLIYILFFLTPVFSYIVWQKFQQTIKKILIKNMLFDLALQKKQTHHLSLFRGILFEMAAKSFIKASKKTQKQILENLKNGDTEKLFEYICSKEYPLAFALQHILPATTLKKMPRQNTKTTCSKLTNGIIHECVFEYGLIKEDLKQIPRLMLSRKNRALRQLLTARFLFLQTDLKKASKLLLKTTKDLRKTKLYDELAYAYFMLGEIYRISGLNDVAEIMFTSAFEIYKKTNHDFGQTFILATKGLNCIQSKRFEEAESHLNKALSHYKKNNDLLHEAEILNQKALLLNTQGKHHKAYLTAQKALKKHEFFKNKTGLAFSFEQMAVSSYNKGELKKAEKFAQMAKKYYKDQQNHIAFIESLSFLTSVYIKQKQFEKAKKNLTSLKYNQKKYCPHFPLEKIKKLEQDIGAEKIKTK